MNINEVMDSLEEFRESGNCDFTLVKIDESYEYNELNELSKINSFKFGYGFEYDYKSI